jgi:hypothetical protein
MRGTVTITVVRKPRVDRLKPTPAVEQRFDIPGCVVWPRASNEADQGWVQISGENVFCPPGSDVVAEDEVLLRGSRYSVKGEPGFFETKKGKAKGIMVTLEKVT